MKNTIHKVQYYETDKMQITHHSNYLRFMEEARTDFLEQVGYSYQRMESENLISPVVSVNINYKKSTTYADMIEIETKVKEVTAVRVVFEYVMRCKGEIVCTASSVHCFIDLQGRPVSLKRIKPELFEMLLSLVAVE